MTQVPSSERSWHPCKSKVCLFLHELSCVGVIGSSLALPLQTIHPPNEGTLKCCLIFVDVSQTRRGDLKEIGRTMSLTE